MIGVKAPPEDRPRLRLRAVRPDPERILRGLGDREHLVPSRSLHPLQGYSWRHRGGEYLPWQLFALQINETEREREGTVVGITFRDSSSPSRLKKNERTHGPLHESAYSPVALCSLQNTF